MPVLNASCELVDVNEEYLERSRCWLCMKCMSNFRICPGLLVQCEVAEGVNSNDFVFLVRYGWCARRSVESRHNTKVSCIKSRWCVIATPSSLSASPSNSLRLVGP